MSWIIDDDNGTAKELWGALERLYKTLNEQTVIHLVQELEQMRFKDGRNREEHFKKFHLILGILFSLEKPVANDEKSFKIIRTMPDHFATLEMMSSKMTS